jgi:hypothetical protein
VTLVVLCGVEGHVYCLKLDRGELTEAALPALAVVGLLDPDHDREAEFLPGRPSLPVEDVLLQEGEEGFHPGVVAARADSSHRPGDAVVFQHPHEGVGAAWEPRSECRIVPSISRCPIALRAAATARDAFIRESMEWPTILFE